MATKLKSVQDELDARDAERERLIAFYRAESPWMVQKIENLERGCPLSADDHRVLAGLNAAFRIAA